MTFPARALERFGPPGRVWIDEMITAVIDESLRSGEVRMDAPTLAVMNELREFMFERVYLSPDQRVHTDPAVKLIRRLVDYHLERPSELPDELSRLGCRPDHAGSRLRRRDDR